MFDPYVILPDLARVPRLLRGLIIPFPSLVILLVLLLIRDRFLLASRSSVQSGYPVRGDEMTTHGTYGVSPSLKKYKTHYIIKQNKILTY